MLIFAILSQISIFCRAKISNIPAYFLQLWFKIYYFGGKIQICTRFFNFKLFLTLKFKLVLYQVLMNIHFFGQKLDFSRQLCCFCNFESIIDFFSAKIQICPPISRDKMERKPQNFVQLLFKICNFGAKIQIFTRFYNFKLRIFSAKIQISPSKSPHQNPIFDPKFGPLSQCVLHRKRTSKCFHPLLESPPAECPHKSPYDWLHLVRTRTRKNDYNVVMITR